ncbi:hypothetical protein H6F89_01035 [Cyanobacteria bacterium FACHB-63]|nr:hypothetical protein [Cyanobacteria bacterium FACHB-63]
MKKRLNLATPAIAFFAVPANQQIELLPFLESKHKYDFPDGDLYTDNALEVLLAAYQACLNMLLNWLITMLDESENQELENLEILIENLFGAAQTISEYRFQEIGNVESLDTSEWCELRHFSEMLQQRLHIELEVNTAILSSFMDYWLHP